MKKKTQTDIPFDSTNDDKSRNEERKASYVNVAEIVSACLKFKQNPASHYFAKCVFDKPCIGVNGEVYKCCLCKADGGFFWVDKCTVPCVMYHSNKIGEYITNKYGFSI